jgi:acyl carrier protein
MNTLEKEIANIVAEIIEVEEEELWESRDKHLFEELGLDSLLGLEIIANIEKKYKIQIEEEQLKEITSLNKTIEIVKNAITGKT